MKRVLLLVPVLTLSLASWAPYAGAQAAPASAEPPGTTTLSADPVAPKDEPTSTEAALSVVTTYQVPDAPASVLLGSAATLERPGTPGEVGAALINLVTPEGTVRSGAAIEVSLRALGVNVVASHYEYKEDLFARMLYNFAVSLATVADSKTDLAPATTRLALGARLVLYDESDPLLETRYGQRAAYVESACASEQDGIARTNCIVKVNNSLTDAQLAEFHQPRWNGHSAAISAAVDWAFADGKLDAQEKDTYAIWAAGSLGLSDWFHASLGFQHKHVWPTDSNIEAIAVRLRAGTHSLRAVAEGSYSFLDPEDPALKRGRLALGSELRLGDATWLSASIGGDFAAENGPSSVFVLSNLKVAFIDKPTEW